MSRDRKNLEQLLKLSIDQRDRNSGDGFTDDELNAWIEDTTQYLNDTADVEV